jgi:hypothetical protein
MKQIDLTDMIFVLGLVLVGVGIGLISIPAALVVVGVVLMGISVLGAVRSGAHGRKKS